MPPQKNRLDDRSYLWLPVFIGLGTGLGALLGNVGVGIALGVAVGTLLSLLVWWWGENKKDK